MRSYWELPGITEQQLTLDVDYARVQRQRWFEKATRRWVAKDELYPFHSHGVCTTLAEVRCSLSAGGPTRLHIGCAASGPAT